jgi:ferredoxin
VAKQIDQKVLVKLIDRLNRYPIGLPDAPEIREFLSIFLTEDEAYIGSLFPLREATARELAKKTGWNVQKTEEVLNGMAEKGAVIDFYLTDKDQYWLLTPSIIGFIELSLMKTHQELPMKQMAKLLYKYEHDKLLEEVFGSKTQFTRALIEHDVPISSEVMTYAEVAEVIKDAGGGSVQRCFCRQQAELLDRPCKVSGYEEICITLGKGSDFLVRRGFGRRASAQELLEITRELGEKGLIHVTDNVRERPSFVCNCCGCCCGLLAGIRDKNIPHAVAPTPYILSIDQEKCNGCALCSKKCQISAITVTDKKARVDEINCLGCGSCVKFCKVDALSLKKRKKVPKLPRNSRSRFGKIAFEKGRLWKLLLSSLRSKLGRAL